MQRKKLKMKAVALAKYSENIWKKPFKIGLIGAAYLGLRTIIGPEIDFHVEKITNAWQILDGVGACASLLFGVAGGIPYAIMYANRKSCEKDLKNAESELEKISEEYKLL
jgi:hypothetical protein